jgi:transposase
LVIRSLQQAKVAEAGLQARMEKAQAALEALNDHRQGKTHFREEIELLRQAAEAIVKKYRVEGLLNLSYEEVKEKHPLRRYGKRLAGTREEREARLCVKVDQGAMNKAKRRLGMSECMPLINLLNNSPSPGQF